MTLFLIRHLFEGWYSGKEELIRELIKNGRYLEICEIREALFMKSHEHYDISVIAEFIAQEELDLARRYIKKFRPNPTCGLECVFENKEYIQWIKDYYRVKINLN